MLGPASGQVKPASSSDDTKRRGDEFIVSEAVAEPSLGGCWHCVFCGLGLPVRRLTGRSNASGHFRIITEVYLQIAESFPCPSAAVINECLLYFVAGAEIRLSAAGVRQR